MTAPDLSPAEAAIVARFDAAPTLPEAYQPSPVALLDQLDELRAKATPGPWQQDDEYPEDIVAPRTAGLDVASCDEGPADAALIVAAVNAVGPLAAAVRAVLELADEAEARNERASFRFFDGSKPRPYVQVDAIRAAITAALSVTP